MPEKRKPNKQKNESGWKDIVPTKKEDLAKIVAAGAGFTFFGAFIDRGLGILTRIILARSIGPADYGTLFLAISILSIMISFSVFSMNIAVTRYLAYYRGKKDRSKMKGVILSAIKITAPLSIASFIILFLLAEPISLIIFNKPEMIELFRNLSFILLLQPFVFIFISVTHAFQTIKYDVYSNRIGRTVSTLIALIIFLSLGFGIGGAAFAYVIGYLVAFILSFYFMTKVFPIFKINIPGTPMKKKLLKFAFPILLSSIVWNFNTEMGTILLGLLGSAVDVGIYQSGLPIAMFLLIIPSALTAVFVPMVTTFLAQGRIDSIKRLSKVTFKWVFYLNFPIFIVLFFHSDRIIRIIFGPEYLSAVPVLSILAIAIFLSPINISSSLLYVYNKTRLIFLNTVISILVNFAVIVLLVSSPGPFGGAVGVAIAMAATQFTLNVLCIYESHKVADIIPLSMNIWKAMVIGLAGGLIIWLIPMQTIVLFFVLIIFFALYALILLVSGGIDKDDVTLFKLAEGKVGIKSRTLRRIARRFIK